MSLAEHLYAERKKANLSADALAKACGVSRSYITLLENGRRLPGAKLLAKLAKALGLTNHVVLNWYLEDIRAKMQKDLKS